MNKNKLLNKQRIKDLFHSVGVLDVDMLNLWFEAKSQGAFIFLCRDLETLSYSLELFNYSTKNVKSVVIVINGNK